MAGVFAVGLAEVGLGDVPDEAASGWIQFLDPDLAVIIVEVTLQQRCPGGLRRWVPRGRVLPGKDRIRDLPGQ